MAEAKHATSQLRMPPTICWAVVYVMLTVAVQTQINAQCVLISVHHLRGCCNINPYSAGINFTRQTLMPIDVRLRL